MDLSIAHICILTNDLEVTYNFYTKILGMSKVFDFIKDDELFGYYLKMADGNFIEVFKEEARVEKNQGSYRHLCLETKDIQKLHKKMCSNGIEATDIKKGCDNTYQFWIKDPNGMDIEFHQYTFSSSQLTGVSCQVDW
jgi:glyoxylase I family protein